MASAYRLECAPPTCLPYSFVCTLRCCPSCVVAAPQQVFASAIRYKISISCVQPLLQRVAFAASNNLRTGGKTSPAPICAQTYRCNAMFRSLAPLCQCLLQSSSCLAPAAANRSCIHSVLERQPTHFSTSSSSQAQRARNAPLADPWTPTSQLVKRKTYQKRSRFLIQVGGQPLLQQQLYAPQLLACCHWTVDHVLSDSARRFSNRYLFICHRQAL